ncbi:hypothetical protein [uncultured Kordia sp.]|uniref:hypothetical protein n=1 Tax=uncultured Kordia sp. TaxID=507699 RepID=UPI002631BF77|nr:hypothetical protein [uncultured Kordia sp.]
MTKDITTCKECKSEYFTETSKKESLCTNCAHYLYGQKRCFHIFTNERCAKCYWNGTVSERIAAMIKRNKKKLKKINTSIGIATFILIISLPTAIYWFVYLDTTVFSLTKHSFSRNVWFFMSVFGVLVSISFLIKANAFKKQLIKEVPYLKHN